MWIFDDIIDVGVSDDRVRSNGRLWISVSLDSSFICVSKQHSTHISTQRHTPKYMTMWSFLRIDSLSYSDVLTFWQLLFQWCQNGWVQDKTWGNIILTCRHGNTSSNPGLGVVGMKFHKTGDRVFRTWTELPNFSCGCLSKAASCTDVCTLRGSNPWPKTF